MSNIGLRSLATNLSFVFATAFAAWLTPVTAHAVLTVSSIGGASASDIAASNGAVTIYGGVAGNTDRCDATDGTNTCNNCRLKAGEAPPFTDAILLGCNERRIYPNLQLVINISSDAIDGYPYITSSDGTTPITTLSSTTLVAKGTVTSIVVLWQNVCTRVADEDGNQTATACVPSNTNAAAVLRVGISPTVSGALSGTGDDVKNINFIIRSGIDETIGTPSLAEKCADAGSSPMICYFEVGPGDEKAVVKSLLAPADSGFPAAQNTQAKYVRFLFAQNGFDQISLASDHVDLPISGTDTNSFNVSPRRIEGLRNDIKYFMKNAIVDMAGNVSLYSQATTDTDCSNAVDPSRTDCRTVTPSEVVGVLDKTNCFIATAAYGTPFASELDTLRDFRDQILLRSGAGHSFVRWYYEHSPKYAKMILAHPLARATVRAGLVPVVWFAGMALAYGPFKAGLAFLVSLIAIAALVSLGRRPDVRAAARENYLEMKKRARRSFLPLFFAAIMIPSLSAHRAEAATTSTRRPAQATKSAANSELQSLEDETPPEPEYPYPGARGTTPETPLAELPAEPLSKPAKTTNANSEIDIAPAAAVEAPLPPLVKKPKAITEDGDYIYEKLPDTPPKKYGRPKAKKFSKQPGREKPLTITADGEFQYPVEHSPFTGAAGFRFGMMSPPNIKNGSNGLNFKDIYGAADVPGFVFEYEYPLTRKIGRVGIKFETGVYSTAAAGRFKNPQRAGELPEERFTFLMIPLQALLHYRFQYADSQMFVPFIEGGGGYNGIAELRDDNKKPRLGGAPAIIAGGGVNILLDWIDRRAIHQLDADYGINHVWFTAQYRQVIGLKSDLDISSHLISGGFTFDF